MSAGPRDAQSEARLTELTIQNLYSAGKQTDVLNDSVVISLAKKHDKTPAQVLLRHLIQLDVVVIPKSITPQRIQQNIQIFDFHLSDDQMEQQNAIAFSCSIWSCIYAPGADWLPLKEDRLLLLIDWRGKYSNLVSGMKF